MDRRTWIFGCSGLVEQDLSWTWEEFVHLPCIVVESDLNCVTRWSRFDNLWGGVSVLEILSSVKLRPDSVTVPRLHFWKSAKRVRAFESLDVDPPGFREMNAYHVRADPWREECYSDQETHAMQWMRAETA